MKRRKFLIAAGAGLSALTAAACGMRTPPRASSPASAVAATQPASSPITGGLAQTAGISPSTTPTMEAVLPVPSATSPVLEPAQALVTARRALLDEFADACAPGAVDGTTATDGFSRRVLVSDSAGQVSIAGGSLRIEGTAPVQGGPRLYDSLEIHRADGQALGFRFRVEAGKELPSLGLIQASGRPLAALRRSTAEGGGGIIECGEDLLAALNLYSGCWYDAAVFLRSSGAAFAINDGAGLELVALSESGGDTPGFLGCSAAAGVEQGASVDCWYAPEAVFFPPAQADEPHPAQDYRVDLGTNAAWVEARITCGTGKAGLRFRGLDDQNEYRVYLEDSHLKVEQVIDGSVTQLSDEAVVTSDGGRLAARFNELTLTLIYQGEPVGLCSRKIGCPALIGATRAGIYAQGEGSRFEQFLALPVILEPPDELGGRLLALRRVLCLGDSLTSADHAFGYQNRLRKQLGDAWVTVDGGVGGQTSSQMLARLPYHLRRWQPEVVVVLGGTNDAWLGESAGQTITNLQGIYTAAQAAGARVAAVTLPPCGGAKNWGAEKLDVIDQVNAWILSRPAGVDTVIDAFQAFEEPGTRVLKRVYNGGDHIHLSPLAYNTLGNMIYAAVRP